MSTDKKETYLNLAHRDFRWLETTQDAIEPVFVSEGVWRIRNYLKNAFEELSALDKSGNCSNEQIEKRIEKAVERLHKRNLEFIRTKDL